MIKILETKERDEKGIIVGSSRYEVLHFWEYGDYATNIFSDVIHDLFIKRSCKTADIDYSRYSSEMSYSKVKGNPESTRCVIVEKTDIDYYDTMNKFTKGKSVEQVKKMLLDAPFGVDGKTSYILKTYQDNPIKGIYYLSKYNSVIDSVNIWVNKENVDTKEVDKTMKKLTRK